MSVLIGIVLVCAAAIVAAAVTLVSIATLVEILPPLFAEECEEDEAPQVRPGNSRRLTWTAATGPAEMPPGLV